MKGHQASKRTRALAGKANALEMKIELLISA
jgi:hypothetical protein